MKQTEEGVTETEEAVGENEEGGAENEGVGENEAEESGRSSCRSKRTRVGT